MRDSTKGYLLVFLATMIWGTSALIVRMLDTDAYHTTFFRTFLSGLILLLLVRRISLKKIRKDLFPIIVSALGSLGGFVFYFLSVKSTTVSIALLSLYTVPLFTALLARLIIDEKWDRYTWIALPMGFIGLMFLVPGDISLANKDIIGILFGIAGAVSLAFFVVYSKFLTKRHSSKEILMYQMLIVAMLLLPFINPLAQIKPGSILLIAVFVLFNTLGAYLLFIYALKFIKAQHAEILSYFEALFAIFFAALFLKEMPGLDTLAGGILIIAAGIIIMQK